ncbi:uncharacterized protein LOC112082050 [Eutrema salsugineum]|uniref:uncharacterized protein LOC112082050 n=1 Tax=Eutrema salsugineum TaxID=72664 RepID=UPI000CED76A9|nr:uncharacterized protein LOC112082050 [Eutrema salsugineum]
MDNSVDTKEVVKSYLKPKTIVSALIDEIDRTSDRYKIKVQIINLWKSYRKNKVTSIEMVLADEVGSRIHATVDGDLVEQFNSELTEGHVIGQVVSLETSDVIAQGKPIKKLDVVLSNASDNRLTCTLWGNFGKKVIDYVTKNSASVIVCVVRFASVSEWKGVYSISNSFNATQIFLDPHSKQIEDFRALLPTNAFVISNEPKVPSSSTKSVSWRDEFFDRNERKTIQGIVYADTEMKCVAAATVVRVEYNPILYYIACRTCDKTVHPIESDSTDDDSVLFDCRECGEAVSDVVARYKLVLVVSDESGEDIRFLLFDKIASAFLRVQADTLAEEVAEDGTLVLP